MHPALSLRLGIPSVVALVLAAGCGASETRPATSEPRAVAASSGSNESFAACVSDPLSPTVPRIRCGGFALAFIQAPTLSNAAALDALEGQVASRGPSEAVTLQGRDGPFPARVGQGFALGAPLPGILVMCTAPGSTECPERLVSISHTGLPPQVTFASAEDRAVFRGRTVTVPDGCQRVGAERIVCSTGVLDSRSGFTSRHTADEALEQYVQLIAARFHAAPLEDEQIVCALAGSTGVGRRTRWALPDGQIDNLTCMLSDAEGQLSAATCMGELPRGSPPPAPCDQLFDGPLP